MWRKVGKLSDIDEGKARLAQLNGKDIALFKISGHIYALENACCHRGGPLVEGYLEGMEVTCPWHAWAYDVKTGVCSTAPDIKQPVFQVKIDNGAIFVLVATT